MLEKPNPLTIEAISHDGRGLAHINGKITFIDGALPNEEVTFKYLSRHNKFDEATVTEILKSSQDRVKPLCPHFGICGGCSLQHLNPNAQLTLKQQILFEQLKHFGNLEPKITLEPLTGPIFGYRHKARLSVKYVQKKEKLLIGFHEKNGRFVADINQCPILHPTISNLLPELNRLISSLSIFAHIPQIEAAVSNNVTAFILRHLQEFTTSDLEALSDFAKKHEVHLYLQPKGIDSIQLFYPKDSPDTLNYRHENHGIDFFFAPSDFTQINPFINAKMVEQALQLLEPNKNDNILDLFCGLGNFSLPFAKFAKHVTGIEGDENLVNRAKSNAKHNQIENAEFYKIDLTKDITNHAWARNSFNKIILDPPRTGAIEIIKQLPMFKAEKILYISCNPATFARDAKELNNQGYKLLKVGIMDMFPHTSHVEVIGLFVNPSFRQKTG